MANAQGQDVIRCQFCSNPVEHYCNLCHVDLCLSCVPKHMADKSRRHEVVEYTFKKTHAVILPSCLTHEKNQCETYCHDCKIPICIQCLIGSHKTHGVIDINDILQKQKLEIDAHTKELENTILPKYKNINSSTNTVDFDKVLTTIKEQEDKICKSVREASIQLTDKVAKQKTEAERICKENKSFAEKAEKAVKQIIKRNKDILKGNDATAILDYQSSNDNFQKGPELPSFSCTKLLPGIIEKEQIVQMLGFLQTGEDTEKKPEKLKMLDEPVVLSTLQSPYGHPNIYVQMFGRFPELWRVQYVGRDMILTSGNDKTIKQINMTGSSLKTIHTNENVLALTTNSQHEPVFCLSNARQTNTDIYIYNKIKVNVLLSTVDWFHVGICYSANGNPLVSMRSMDKAQSRVVRYSGTTEIQTIQYDSLRKALFSTRVTMALLLTENRNGDICVADHAGKAVVVVDSSGELRFNYKGNLSIRPKFKDFDPLNITTLKY